MVVSCGQPFPHATPVLGYNKSISRLVCTVRRIQLAVRRIQLESHRQTLCMQHPTNQLRKYLGKIITRPMLSYAYSFNCRGCKKTTEVNADDHTMRVKTT